MSKKGKYLDDSWERTSTMKEFDTFSNIIHSLHQIQIFLSILFLSKNLAFYDPPSNKFYNQTDAKMFMYLSNCTKFSTSRIFWHREQFHSWVQLLSGKVMHNFKLDSWYFTPFDCQNHIKRERPNQVFFSKETVLTKASGNSRQGRLGFNGFLSRQDF